jgi:CheY-like chemotaxis protein
MKKVLIIEDDQITRNCLTRILEEQGYSIVTTTNGPDGITAALRERPNLVVLDLGLPSPKPCSVEFSGFSVIQWLKRSAATRNIPVIVATAWPVDESREKCVALGAEGFLHKPIKPGDLRTTVKILMDDY